jgi:hypothetical protein
MKQLLLAFGLLSLFSGACKNGRSKSYAEDLPNDSLIYAVVSTVIDVDSLYTGSLISDSLIIPNVYILQNYDKATNSQPEPPPPPSLYDYSYSDLFFYFNSINNPDKRQRDSLYIEKQIDGNNKHKISRKVLALFTNERNSHYCFSLPIFSSDKQIVAISYINENRYGCYTILKREKETWKKIDHHETWIR